MLTVRSTDQHFILSIICRYKEQIVYYRVEFNVSNTDLRVYIHFICGRCSCSRAKTLKNLGHDILFSTKSLMMV